MSSASGGRVRTALFRNGQADPESATRAPGHRSERPPDATAQCSHTSARFCAPSSNQSGVAIDLPPISERSFRPELLGGDARALDQRPELGPADIGIAPPAEATVDARDDILTSHQVRVAHDSIGNQL